MTAALDWNAIAQMSAARIVDCLIEGTLIALFAGLVLKLSRQRSSRIRFAVWFSALMAIAALPLLSSAWRSHAGSISAGGVASRAAIILPGSWALYLVAAWAAMAGWSLLRVGAGLVHLRALRRSCVPVDPDSLDAGVRETLLRNQGRPVALCLSDHVHVPTAIGFGKPAVVVPAWLMKELSSSELDQVVLHELAHLRRWDDWTNLAQKIVKALLCFHPAIWWIERRLSLEREMACDDAVLAETASPRAYAECLAHLAEKSLIRRSMALAQAAVGRIRQTSLRVARILDVNRPAGTKRAWKPAVSLVAGFAVASAVGVSKAPRLVAFQDSAVVHAFGPGPVVASKILAKRTGVKAFSPTEAQAQPLAWKRGTASESARLPKARRRPANVAPASSGLETFESAFMIARPDPRPGAGAMVHLAGAGTPRVASTETMFVVVEGQYASRGQAVYQISVWRITLPQPAHGSIGKTTPRKT
ncbi:MAG: M56 family metallopeptidase [Candidatus Sulfotelmatobacter sp.]